MDGQDFTFSATASSSHDHHGELPPNVRQRQPTFYSPPTWPGSRPTSARTVPSRPGSPRTVRRTRGRRHASPRTDRHPHNVLIGRLVRAALDAPKWRWMGLDHANAALTVIRYTPDRPASVLFYNDVGHLPPELRWTGFPPDIHI
jgi:hypothetical protein